MELTLEILTTTEEPRAVDVSDASADAVPQALPAEPRSQDQRAPASRVSTSPLPSPISACLVEAGRLAAEDRAYPGIGHGATHARC